MTELVSKKGTSKAQQYRVKTNLNATRLCTRTESCFLSQVHQWDTGSECIGLYSPTLANQSQTESVVYVFLRTCDLCHNRVFKQYGLSATANGTQTSNAKLKWQKHLPFLTLNTCTIRRGKTETTTTTLCRMDRNMAYVFQTDYPGLHISMEFIHPQTATTRRYKACVTQTTEAAQYSHSAHWRSLSHV